MCVCVCHGDADVRCGECLGKYSIAHCSPASPSAQQSHKDLLRHRIAYPLSICLCFGIDLGYIYLYISADLSCSLTVDVCVLPVLP